MPIIIGQALKGLSDIGWIKMSVLKAYPQPKSFPHCQKQAGEKDLKAFQALLPFSPQPAFGRVGTTCITSRRQKEGQD